MIFPVDTLQLKSEYLYILCLYFFHSKEIVRKIQGVSKVKNHTFLGIKSTKTMFTMYVLVPFLLVLYIYWLLGGPLNTQISYAHHNRFEVVFSQSKLLKRFSSPLSHIQRFSCTCTSHCPFLHDLPTVFSLLTINLTFNFPQVSSSGSVRCLHSCLKSCAVL